MAFQFADRDWQVILKQTRKFSPRYEALLPFDRTLLSGAIGFLSDLLDDIQRRQLTDAGQLVYSATALKLATKAIYT